MCFRQLFKQGCLFLIFINFNGCKYDIVTLGPIGVLPEYQNRDIGALLLDRSKVIAKELGYKAIVLCGDPDYYRRHEFEQLAGKVRPAVLK